MKEYKEVIKQEVRPLIIGIRNEVKGNNEVLKRIVDKISLWKRKPSNN